METKQNILKQKLRRKGLPPAVVVMSGFVMIIAVGTFFLALPISAKSGEWTSFADALLVAASMTCITGISFAPVGVYFSPFGQAVILLLIQIGALGFMTVTSFILLIVRRKIQLKDKIALQATVGGDGSGVKKLVRYIVIFTFSVELIGALFLLCAFVPRYGAAGIWHAVFVSVSAFCNAGVDVIGGEGFTVFAGSPFVLSIVGIVVFLGGLGFIVVADLVKNRFRFKKLSLHSKLALSVSAVLLVSGFFFFIGSEWNHAASTGSFNGGTKIIAALFETVSCRTAGFSVYRVGSMSAAGTLMRDILSFIGASPGSTGGGLKTTTFAVLIMTVVSGIRRKDEVVLFRRSVSVKTVYKAFSVLLVGLFVIAAATVLLLFFERGIEFSDILSETVGAFSTAGTGRGVTANFSGAGKILITITMFMGRIGMLPVTLLFTAEESNIIKYPEANIPIG